jgi:hypothetical protein
MGSFALIFLFVSSFAMVQGFVDSDYMSLLQTAVAPTATDNDAVATSLDNQFQGAPPDCEPAMRMDIGSATVASSNLGRQGPDNNAPEGILFKNVLSGSGQNVDLLVNAKSEYTALNVKGNGKVNSFGRVNVATGTSVDLSFSFQDGDTQEPVLMKPFTMSFVDLDEQKDEGAAREWITIMDEHEYILTSTTVVGVSADGGATSFHSTAFGRGSDNPRGAMELTQAQKDKTVQVVFPSLSTFSVSFAVGDTPGPNSGNARNILFAGQTNVWCPPDAPLADSAECTTMECPTGWKLKPTKKIQGVFCETDTCAVETDLKTCCQVDYCSKARMLTLNSQSLTRNNLGNLGPDSGEEGILFENVFPQSDDNVHLLINVKNSDYAQNNDAINKVRGGIGKINSVTGGQADMTWTFLDAATNQPTSVDPFVLTFLDFDEQQDEGKAREFVTVKPYNKYKVSGSTLVHVATDGKKKSAVTFSSTTFGEGEDNVQNIKQMTEVQKDKSVSVYMPEGSSFNVLFEVARLPGEGNGRNIQFTGATSMVC